MTRRIIALIPVPGMIHCYAMLPYFKESKEDFDEIIQILKQ